MIARFAPLGPEWDARLIDAYTGGHAADRCVGAISRVLDGGLVSADSLDELIAPFGDEAMLRVIATERRLGRGALVATTAPDSQSQSIWNGGEFAAPSGEDAVSVFRSILAASVNSPGLFPPRLVRREVGGEPFDELHVAGGASVPLLILPDSLSRWRRLGPRLRRGRVCALFAMVIGPSPQPTALTPPAILIRSFDTMLSLSYRQVLNVATGFCLAQNIPLSVAVIPASPAGVEHGAILDFKTPSQRVSFEAGRAPAKDDAFWGPPAVRLEPWEEFLELPRP